MSHESTKKTLFITVTLSLICSVMVSLAVVLLKPYIHTNAMLDLQKNILSISGLSKNVDTLSNSEIDQLYQNVQPRLVNLKTGKFIVASEQEVKDYNQRLSAKQPDLSRELDNKTDIAKINRQANIAKVFLIKREGKVQSVMLPVHGYGLWSTLYGFIALDIKDLNTIVGFGFYDQKETPGLGGEVDNPAWKALWPGKKVYDKNLHVLLHVIKGTVTPTDKNAQYKIDGLAGASLTSNGVSNLIQFWMSEQGFLPFLQQLKAGEI